MNIKKVIISLRWLPALGVSAAIAWLTLAPHPLPENDIPWFEGADKVVHFIMFATLMATVVFGLHLSPGFRNASAQRPKRALRGRILAGALCVVIFAALDEWAQGAMQMGRSAETADFLADLAGIAAITIAALLYRHPKKG